MRRFLLSWMAVGLIGSMSGVTRGGVVRVDTNGTGNGSSWALASSLSNALANAQGGDALWIAQGVYTNSGDGVTSFVLSTNNLTLYGGFTNGMENLGDRNWTNYPTILSGADTNRVLLVTSTNAVLDGLWIANGTYNGHGGGLYKNTAGTLEMINCVVVSNRTFGDDRQGWGCYLANCTVTIRNSQFRWNGRSTWIPRPLGLGVYASSVTLRLDGCTFNDNYCSGGWNFGGQGSAFYCTGGSLTATNCVFERNEAGGAEGVGTGGGAGYLGGACTATIRDCIFRANKATYGGALRVAVNSGTTVSVDNCTFAGQAGTFYGSQLSSFGGAIYQSSGDLHVRNCLMVSNTASGSAPGGGAVYAAGGNFRMTNCTVAANIATNGTGKGGGVYVNLATVSIGNSILWSNDAATADEIYNAGGTVSVGYSCLNGTGAEDLYGTISQDNVITYDPLFASPFGDVHLKSTAGRWDPATAGWTNDTASSPCIDAGNPASDYADEPGDNGGRINMGVYGNTWQASKSPPAVAPTAENRGTTVTNTSATMRGELTAGTPSKVIIYCGTNAANLDSQSSVQVQGDQPTGVVFQATIHSLLPNQLYYYACFATNNAGTDWADADTFTTGPEGVGGGVNIIHVKSDAAGAQNGLNWHDAFRTVVAGAVAAKGGTNEMWIAAGTYLGGGSQITVATNMSIYGGFAGFETERSQRSSANVVTLDGGALSRVMLITGTNVLLDGLRIYNGAVSGNGAGIYKDTAGTLEMVGCTIIGNKTTSDDTKGYGIYAANCRLSARDCVFRDNFRTPWSIRIQGLALCAVSANVVLDRCTFMTNYASGSWAQAQWGGGFYASGGSLLATNCAFVGNGANASTAADPAGGGGGYLTGACAAQVRNCVFLNNWSQSVVAQSCYHGFGGGLYVAVSATTTVTVENCTFSGNSAYAGGGALYAASGNLIVKNSILWTNSATLEPGKEILATNAAAAVVSYSDLTGTNAPHVVTTGSATLTWGLGILSADPLFASPTDLHLKSPAGRWVPATGSWTNDPRGSYSTCIDAGDPASPRANEPVPNGLRINMGAYGNTAEASKSRVAGSVFVVQ